MLGHALRAAAKTPSVSYANRYSSNTNAASFTFNTSSIGTADNSRLVVVQVHGLAASGTITVDSLTIGGTSANGYENTARLYHNSLWTLAVAAGTTANIVVNFSATANNCLIGVYALYNLNSTTPVATNATFASSTTISNTIDAREKGVVIAGITGDAGSTTTWTGVTERYDQQVETDVRSGGNATIAATNASYSVQAVIGASGNIVLAIGSWR